MEIHLQEINYIKDGFGPSDHSTPLEWAEIAFHDSEGLLDGIKLLPHGSSNDIKYSKSIIDDKVEKYDI